MKNTKGTAVNDYTYDQNGSILTSTPKSLTTINYDKHYGLTSRIERVDIHGGTTNTYFHYGRGGRTYKYDLATTGAVWERTAYIRGLNSYPIIEKTKNQTGANTTTRYVYGPQGLIASQQAGVLYFHLRDHLGSSRIVLHDNGNVVSVFHYGPTGKISTETQGENSPYKFTGQECDDETGLHNFRARMYDSDLGRFYGADPLATQFASWSPYHYAYNNPCSFKDPTGMSSMNTGHCAVNCGPPSDWFGSHGGGVPDHIRNGTSQSNHEFVMYSGPSVFGGDMMGFRVDSYNFQLYAEAERKRRADGKQALNNWVSGALAAGGGSLTMSGGLAFTVTHDAEYSNYGNMLGATAWEVYEIDVPPVLYASVFPAEFGHANNLLNAGSTLIGIGELGLQYMRQHPNGPRDIARGINNLAGKRVVGTQATAQFLKSTLNGTRTLGARLGGAGALLSTGDYLLNGGEKNGYEHANYWIGMAVFAGSFLNPVGATIAVGYGIGQLGSYLYNGKTLEENIGASLGL